MKCSIIIPYAYSSDRTVRLLNSLEKQDFPKSEYELIFVNYGDRDDFAEYLAKRSNNVVIKSLSFPGGKIGQAKNLGVKKAVGELIIFINGDEIATKNFVSGHYESYRKFGRPVMQFGLTKEVFEDNEQTALETRKLFGSGIRYWLSEPEIYGLDKRKSYYFLKDVRLNMLEPYSYDFNKVQNKMIFTQTSNLSIPMECIRKFGGIDENYSGLEIEDWEFGYRMMKNGVEFVYNPQVAVLHLYEKPRFNIESFNELEKNLDRVLMKQNDSFRDAIVDFKYLFESASKERLKRNESVKIVWLDFFKRLERAAKKPVLAEI